MPTYEYRCDACDLTKELFFKSLPSEKLQRQAACDSCGNSIPRIPSEFAAVGGTNFDVQKAAMIAVPKEDQGGRPVPVYTDQNGKRQEIRNSRDIDNWTVSNQLGRPRMVQHYNPVTGQKSWVPQRTVMKTDRKTGELLDVGAAVREPAKLVPLPDNFDMPSESRTGRPLKGGVLKGPNPTANLMGDDDGLRGATTPHMAKAIRGK